MPEDDAHDRFFVAVCSRASSSPALSATMSTSISFFTPSASFDLGFGSPAKRRAPPPWPKIGVDGREGDAAQRVHTHGRSSARHPRDRSHPSRAPRVTRVADPRQGSTPSLVGGREHGVDRGRIPADLHQVGVGPSQTASDRSSGASLAAVSDTAMVNVSPRV